MYCLVVFIKVNSGGWGWHKHTLTNVHAVRANFNLFRTNSSILFLKIHASIVLALVPFRLETSRIERKNFPSPIALANFPSTGNHCRDILRRAKRTFTKRRCAELLNSPTIKPFWPLAKNLSYNFCKSSFSLLSRSDDSVANISTEKANLFGLLFSNSTLDDSGNPPTSPLRCPMPLPVITFDQVHGLLKSMNVRKASGQDGISSRVLRECASELVPSLVQFFSLCLNTSTFPHCCKWLGSFHTDP
ncbi:UNVERIFIED_CONTAM: hypothetical protein RMT77_007789 [Armadillidium vulgare]